MIPSSSLMALFAGILFVVFAVSFVFRDGAAPKGVWLFPAGLSLAFLAFSLRAVAVEGPWGFWTEHTRNLWGNQIWFDLLLAAGVAWFLIVPPAKSLGMRPLPWLVLIFCMGSIGLLAMVARLLYLQERRGRI